MPHYDDALSLGEALAVYFEANGFGADGGYDDAWVSGKFGSVPFAFPNSAARRRAVPLHDLHHVVTGYDTDGVGEGEIGAWEVASGCGSHLVAWGLNLNALAVGFLMDRRAVRAAFAKGWRSRNYYRRGIDPALLATSVAEARRELLPAAPVVPSWPERAAFCAWLLAGASLVALQAALLLAPILWLGSWLAGAAC